MRYTKRKNFPDMRKKSFSVIVLTCDEHGETNLGFYNFDTKIGVFFRKLTKVIETLNLYGYTHQPIR